MAKNRTVYNTDQVLQYAILVDRAQGFIKSGYGYYDYDNDCNIYDNKSAIVNILLGKADAPEVTEDVIQEARDIKSAFTDNLVAKKLMGTMNSFEESVMASLGKEECDNFGISIIASLPNSFRVQEKRQALEDWFDDMRNKSEFVGKIGERMRYEVLVKDVKYIAKFGIHLVTCVTSENNIIKFFFSKEPDIAGILEGRTVLLTGKVKTHDVSKFSNCNETVFNYVKIEEKDKKD